MKKSMIILFSLFILGCSNNNNNISEKDRQRERLVNLALERNAEKSQIKEEKAQLKEDKLIVRNQQRERLLKLAEERNNQH